VPGLGSADTKNVTCSFSPTANLLLDKNSVPELLTSRVTPSRSLRCAESIWTGTTTMRRSALRRFEESGMLASERPHQRSAAATTCKGAGSIGPRSRRTAGRAAGTAPRPDAEGPLDRPARPAGRAAVTAR
jgi:hypothetical protein